MSLPMILTRCMAHPFIPILPFTIRLPAITQREWRSHLESDSLLERHGAVVGAGGVGGAATTTSTIILSATRILMAATATTLGVETAHRINQLSAGETAVETPAGSTIRNI